jgi:hypothetical protein
MKGFVRKAAIPNWQRRSASPQRPAELSMRIVATELCEVFPFGAKSLLLF